jgi:hypothetical protein
MAADAGVENHDYRATDQEIADWYELPLEDVLTILAFAEHGLLKKCMGGPLPYGRRSVSDCKEVGAFEPRA